MALYVHRLNAGVAVGASTTRTLWQLTTPSTVRSRIVEWSISSDGSAAGQGILVVLARQTTAGTATTRTARLYDTAGDTAALTTITDTFSSTEPTTGDILESYYLQPFGGLILKQYPLGREPVLAASTRLGLFVTTPAGVNPTLMSHVVWERA